MKRYIQMTTSRNFESFYEAVWNKYIEDLPDGYEVDQNTQGGQGSTTIYADDGLTKTFYEDEAWRAVKEVFDSVGWDISAGVDGLEESGSGWMDPDYDDYDDSDEW